MTYTDDQCRAIDELSEWVKSDNTEHTLNGAAGSGKTTIAKQFIQNLNYHSSKIAVTAPTHQAKNVIERATDFPSQTIQKLLGLRPHIELDDFNPNRPVFAAKASDTMRYYKIVIIDEASMINAKAKQLITKKAKEYGTKILYMGDAYQLPPVGEYLSKVFSDVSGISTLKEVVRQKLENPMTPVLIALREDIKYNKTDGITRLLNSSEHMVGDMGFKVLSNNKEGFGDALLQYYLSTEYEHNKDHIKLLTYTNDSVETWSEGIRKNILRENSLNLINIGESLIGYNTISNKKTGNVVIQNSASYEVTNVVSASNNYDIEGYYTTLKDENGREFAVFIVDHRKKERFITLLKEVLDKAVLNGGRYWQDYYKFKDQHLVIESLYKDDTKPKDFNNLLCKKDLYYGYAMTVHKSQGSTYDNIAVNVKSIQSNWKAHEVSRLLYVALSRARNTNLILKP